MAEMQSLRRELMESTKAVFAFQHQGSSVPPRPISATTQNLYQKSSQQLSPVLAYQTWYGANHEKPIDSQYTATYSESRRHLSDYSYYGNWDRIFSVMDQARLDFKQDWINCIRRGMFRLTYFFLSQADIYKFLLMRPWFRVGTPPCIKLLGMGVVSKW